MATPLDSIKAIHNAFRTEMTRIDALALQSARNEKSPSLTFEQFRFFNEVLAWHAHGEKVAVFQAVESVVPFVAEAYERDHRGLDAAFDTLNAAASSNDILATARATAAFKFHLEIQPGKEDAHLYRLVRERVSMPDQGKAVGIMANEVHRNAFRSLLNGCIP
jgi:hypothetical protein